MRAVEIPKRVETACSLQHQTYNLIYKQHTLFSFRATLQYPRYDLLHRRFFKQHLLNIIEVATMATLIALAQYLASTLFLCKGVQFNIGRQHSATLAQNSYLIVYVKLFTHC